MRMRMRISQSIAACLLACAWGQGCAGERDPINRVQPNYVEKSFLDGDWYFVRTIVDMPASDTFAVTGTPSTTEKVNWDIQENTLYARRTYEFLKNADRLAEDEASAIGYRGEVLAAFRILSHFDIARAYNESTGEEINVTVENEQDRPWYERKYIRVDWSENLITANDFDLDGASMESVPYFVPEIDDKTGVRNPDAPVFEDNYFDVTTKVFAKPGTRYFPGYGEVPLCWLTDLAECNSNEYTVRNSFLRVGDRQFEARPYKGKETEVFGFFTTQRLVYDVNQDVRWQLKERYLNHHNLWRRVRDNSGNLIPMASREPKPIVYHVNPEFPTEAANPVLVQSARFAADGWNRAFVGAVKAAGAAIGEQRMFILCEHNPVQAGDPKECGAPGTVHRLGDIRYSFMAWVPKYSAQGLLGFGPSNDDPETGETISGNAHFYGLIDAAAQDVTDMVQLLRGAKDPQSFISGLDIEPWIDTVNGKKPAPKRTFGLADAQYLVSKVADGPHARFWEGRRRQVTALDEAEQRRLGARSWLGAHMAAVLDSGIVPTQNLGQAKLAKLAGTPVEKMLVSSDLGFAMGLDPRAQVDEAAMNKASIARGGLVELVKTRQRLLERFAEERRMTLASMADDALIGLAREYAQKNYTEQQVLDEVRGAVYRAIITHETGHTLGLMHNFGGSDDAINYFDKYWEIRAHDGSIEPRINDPMTDYERESRIYDYSYSSIMDYAGRFTIDHLGPGKYDHAAIAFGYANKVEVYRDIGNADPNDLKAWYDSSGDILWLYTTGPQSVHYTTFYQQMGPAMYDAGNRKLVDVSEMNEDFSSTKSGETRVPYIYCSHSHSDLGDNCLTRDTGADNFERMTNLLDTANTWYIVRSFPRGLVDSSETRSYINGAYRRIYSRLKNWHDVFGLYKDLLPQLYDPAQLELFYSDPVAGWGNKTWAVENAFNFLVQTLLMPDIDDSYGQTTTADGQSMFQRGQDGAAFGLDVTNARFYSTSWDDPSGVTCGYFWQECLHHYGFYLDKILAIYTLSDSSTNFVARSTPEDLREWQVSYYSTFADQISKINTAIMNQQWEQVGPYWDSSAQQLLFPNYAGDLLESHGSATQAPVDPLATFTIQLYWQVLGQAFFNSNYDQSFVNESRVFVMGTGQQPDVNPADLVTFTHPVSRRTYGAIRTAGGGGGQALLDRANRLLARSTYCDASHGTARTDDDCTSPSGGYTPEAVGAQLLSLGELIDSLVLVNTSMDFGNPFYP